MNRILLVSESTADFQTRRAIAQLRDGLASTCQIQCLTVGRGGDCRHVLAAALTLMRAQADAIHVWGERCLRAAALSRKPLLFTPAPVASAGAAKWLRAVASQRAVRSVCLSAADHRYLIEQGIAPELCDLVRAGVKLGRNLGVDDELRTRLGAEPDDCLIALLGDGDGWANVRLAVQSVAILHFLNPRYRLLIGRDNPRIRWAVRLAQQWSDRLVIEAADRLGGDGDLDAWLPAANMALCTADERLASLPVLSCMAGGVPLVALATPATSELLEDHHTALLAPPKARRVAQRILQLAEDPELAHRLADRARAEAYEFFSVSRFVSEMRIVYGKLV